MIDRDFGEMRVYVNLLEENFKEHFGSTPVDQLAHIAKEKMPSLTKAVDEWPEDILHIILGELVFFSEPEILERDKIVKFGITCSNQSQVDLSQFLYNRGDRKELPQPLIIHIPNHIIRVIDTTIRKRASFCPEHPDHRFIYQPNL